jgi:hypothetical protein
MIKIMTRLDDGIYASQGGGEVRERYHWNKTSGRNLLLAAKKLPEHRSDMSTAYGNIGCGSSWIEIDGRKVSPGSILEHEIYRLVDDWCGASSYKGTPTQAMQSLLDEIESGEYDKKIDRMHKSMEEQRKREDEELEREMEIIEEERAMGK